MNLFKETDEKLSEIKKNWIDVLFIYAKESDWDDECNEAFLIPVDCFIGFAKTFEYDDGFGGAEVNPTIRIVFTDKSWLERHVYDGAECWEHKRIESPKASCPYDVRYLISNKYEDADMRDKIRFARKESV